MGGLNAICIDDIRHEAKEPHIVYPVGNYPNANIIILSSSARIEEVVSIAESIMEDVRMLDYCGKKLLDAVLGDTDVQGLVDLAYSILENPICIFDSNFTYISYSKAANINNSFWCDMVANGSISRENLAQLRKERVFQNDLMKQSPFLCEKGVFSHERIVDHIRMNNKTVATVIIWGSERPFRKVDLKVTALLVNVLAMAMKKSLTLHYSKVLAFEYFIKDLLDGRLKDDETIAKKLKSFKWIPKDSYYTILAVDMSEYDDTLATQEYIRGRLEELVPGSRALIYGRHVVLLTARNGVESVPEFESGDMGDFFRTEKLYGGLSLEFRCLADMKKHFNQAIYAVDTGRRISQAKAVFRYKDYMLNDLIDLARENRQLKDICHPALLNLQEYDRLNNTCYAYTLELYLKNERNIALTAKVLCTHRNTLLYRIERIKGILGCNLDDDEVRLQLLFTFKVLETENNPRVI
jgi:hypothetical protein